MQNGFRVRHSSNLFCRKLKQGCNAERHTLLLAVQLIPVYVLSDDVSTLSWRQRFQFEQDQTEPWSRSGTVA